MDQAIEVFDLKRMLIGDESPLFLLEIIVRSIIIYAYALALVRWLGGRAIGQLSTVEFLLVIALGSAVGDAMFYPEVPLLHAMLVVTVVVLANKGLDIAIEHSQRAENVIDGQPMEAIRDGVLCKKFLDHKPLTRSEVFQQLRTKGIRQLGEIERAYVEPDGTVSVFRYKGEVRLGLPIVPPPELGQPPRLSTMPADGVAVCIQCGATPGEALAECGNCGGKEWTQAAD